LGGIRGTHAGKILKPILIKSNGYYKVTLSIRNKRYPSLVHDLVARTWIGPKPDGHTVNHKDGKKWRNRADNLEYMTYGENNQHCIDILGRRTPRGEAHVATRLTDTQCELVLHLSDRGYLRKDLAVQFGVSAAQISRIVTGKSRAYLKRSA
jgi:hypothetical protein